VRKGSSPSSVFVQGDIPGPVIAAAGVTGFFPAVLNKTLSALDPAYDIYTTNITEDQNVFTNVLNVGATIAGKNVTDWTYFGIGHAIWPEFSHLC
jgi:hypothetical protein